jgi:predicted transcriptional regulator
MSVTNDDLNNFHQFAISAREDNTDATIEQLLAQWRATKERAETNESIRQGLAEMEAGEGQPLDEFIAEMNAKHNLSMEA